jgi:hypothetical protein
MDEARAYSVLSFLGPYITAIANLKFTLSSPDEKIIATALKGFVRKDPTFTRCAGVIKDLTFIDFNLGEEAPPAWFVQEESMNNALSVISYKATNYATAQEPFSTIRFLLTDSQASLIASSNLSGSGAELTITHWSQNPMSENTEQFRRFLTGLNTLSIMKMMPSP